MLLAQGWRYQQIIAKVEEIHARRHSSDPTLSITRFSAYKVDHLINKTGISVL